MSAELAPVTLGGRRIRLEPMCDAHLPGLTRAAADPELWRWTASRADTPELFKQWHAEALRWRDEGHALPFTLVVGATGEIAGATRYGNYVPEHGRVEIGWTFVARAHQRTAANTEAKLLLLGHAFETLGVRRVELKTDALNTRSRAAIERIGARQEGILRAHVVCHDGRIRDTVCYSILADEWPAVRDRLRERVARDG